MNSNVERTQIRLSEHERKQKDVGEHPETSVVFAHFV